jgi:phospholipid/cholesterol/gamma-HCH transport system substrate-binding protein
MAVGKVRDVGVSDKDNSFIKVTMEIQKGIPIKTDSTAFVNSIGFVGDFYLEISTGSPEAPLLPPGGEIPGVDVATFNDLVAKAQTAIEKIDASLGIVNEQILTEEIPELRERLEVTARNLDRLLNDLDAIIVENRTNISQAIGEIATLVRENREEISATVENFREASRKLNSLADTLTNLVAENREDLDNIIQSLRAAANEAESAAENIDSLISDNADDLTNAMENLESTSVNFRDLSEELADQPWRLLWRTRPQEKQIIEEE